MSALDVLLLGLLVLAGFTGYRRGLVMQSLTYAGLLLGLLAGVVLAPAVAKLGTDSIAQAGLALGTIIVLGGLGNAVGWGVGNRVRTKARETRLGLVDAVGGSLLSVIAGSLVIWFLAQSLVSGPSPTLARQIRSSAIVRTLGDVLPRPPSLVGEARRFLNALGFPDVFAGLPPAPAGRVPPGTTVQVRRAVRAAGPSTVQVVGHACDRIQEGSGFVVAPGYVVTNAHVVAGDTSVGLQAPSQLAATVVAFDPNLDVAVLQVPGLKAPPLLLATAELRRGAQGAVLGYPEGGPFAAEPAAVRRPLSAVGLDIYGKSEVQRSVYELQSELRPGNSGGPFVLPDGEVAGVAFAASTTDGNVGYAIESSELSAILSRSAGATSPVSTGSCTH